MATDRFSGSDCGARQIVHVQRLLKIAAAADQLGLASACMPLQGRRAGGAGAQQKRCAQYRIATVPNREPETSACPLVR